MLTKTDKKEVREIVVEAMTEVMMPVLDKIMKTQDEHSEKFDVIDERLGKVEEDLEDVKLTVGRIETLQRSELERVDDHETRIIKLEKVRAK